MKKLFGILLVLAMSLGIGLTSCQKDDSTTVTDEAFKSTEVYLTSLEPEVEVRGTGDKNDYERIVVEEIVRSNECKGEPVSGIIEFYYDGEMVFSVDFGNGECDGVATISYLDDDNVLQSEVVDVKRLFAKHNEGHHRPRCFEYVFPVDFTMPDGSELTIESAEEWHLLRDWYEANPGYEGIKAEINFPVDITYEDGTTLTINTLDELREARMDCKQGNVQKCFELVLPVSFNMPDGTVITVETEEDYALIREWCQENPEYEDKPELVFPVDIIYEDGTTLTVNTEEEFQEAKMDCKQGFGAKCFEFVLPVSFTMPDESIITITTEDDWALLRAWYDDNPGVEEKPLLIFPVEVVFEDGTTLTVNNQEEMIEVRRDCHPHGQGHGQGHGN